MSVKTHPPFKSICLFSHYVGDDYAAFFTQTLDKLAGLVEHLYVVDDFAVSWPNCPYPSIQPQEINQHCDLIVVLGGDGTMLKAAQIAVPQNLPIVGINRGKLGFLADIAPDDWTQLEAILRGQYCVEARSLLNIKSTTHPKLDRIALNDWSVSRGPEDHMLEFAVKVDDLEVYTQRADGLLISTPTGSTAYALSAGGPILHPRVAGFIMLPICPHRLTSRPLVLPQDSTIQITLSNQRGQSFMASCDGENILDNLIPGEFTLTAATQRLQLIHPLDYHYYDTLRSKLHWERYID